MGPRSQPSRLARFLRADVALILLTLVGAVVLFLIWAYTPVRATPEAVLATRSRADVEVRHVSYGWVFLPRGREPTVGVVLYPGGRISPQAYAPLARDLAKAGYRAAVVELRLNLALFELGAADDPIADAPDLEWIVGGHSLGGVGAARYAAANPDKADGLVLLAAYPDNGTDLSRRGLEAVCVVGSLDTVVDHETLARSLDRLPAGTPLVVINGANHAQFGAYGPQTGDSLAAIPAQRQREETVRAVIELASRIASDAAE